MAELSQLSFIACEVIAVTGLWVVATIANGLMRLQMTRSNNMTWKPLYEVREASWKRKRQGIVYYPPENLNGRTNQCLNSRTEPSVFSRRRCGSQEGNSSRRQQLMLQFHKQTINAFCCRYLSWKMSDKVFVLIIYFICRFVVFASMSTVKNRKQGHKFETFTHKQTI